MTEAECDRPRQLSPAGGRAPSLEDVHCEDRAGDLAPGPTTHQRPEVVVARHAEAHRVPGPGGSGQLHPDPRPGVPGSHGVCLPELGASPPLHDNHGDVGQTDLGLGARLES